MARAEEIENHLTKDHRMHEKLLFHLMGKDPELMKNNENIQFVASGFAYQSIDRKNPPRSG